jgi:hypothetical protein
MHQNCAVSHEVLDPLYPSITIHCTTDTPKLNQYDSDLHNSMDPLYLGMVIARSDILCCCGWRKNSIKKDPGVCRSIMADPVVLGSRSDADWIEL